MTAELMADETAQEVKEWTEIEKISIDKTKHSASL